MVTIPELIVAAGRWPTVGGPKKNTTNAVHLRMFIGDHIPRGEWYDYKTRKNGLELSASIYLPEEMNAGEVAYVDPPSVHIEAKTDQAEREIKKLSGLMDEGLAVDIDKKVSQTICAGYRKKFDAMCGEAQRSDNDKTITRAARILETMGRQDRYKNF